MQPGAIQPGYVAHTLGWPRPFQNVRRRLDLRPLQQSSFHRPGHRARIRRSAIRSPRRISDLENASLRAQKFSKVASSSATAQNRSPTAAGMPCPAITSMAALISRRLRQLSRFPAPQGHSPGHQERHAGRRNNFRSAENRRAIPRKPCSAYQEKIDQSYIKKELWKVRNFHQSFHHGMLGGFFHTALQQITGGRGLIDPMHAEAGYEAYDQNQRPPRPRTIQRRWQTHLRSPDRRLSFRHAPRRRSALPPESAATSISARHTAWKSTAIPVSIFVRRPFTKW